FFFQAEDGIRDFHVTGVQTCALPICLRLAVFLAPLFSAGSYALTLSLAAEDAWPPFSDSQGNGYSRDLAIAAFAHSGVTLNIQRSEERRVGKECRSRWALTQ